MYMYVCIVFSFMRAATNNLNTASNWTFHACGVAPTSTADKVLHTNCGRKGNKLKRRRREREARQNESKSKVGGKNNLKL